MARTPDQVAAELIGRQTLQLIQLQSMNEQLQEQLESARKRKKPCGCRDGDAAHK